MEFQAQGPPYSCRPGVTLNRLVFFFVTVFLLQGYKKSDAKVEINTEVPNIITFQRCAIVVVGGKSLFSFGRLTVVCADSWMYAWLFSCFFLAELKL